MRITTALLAAAPLALSLAACGESESVDEIDASEMDAAALPTPAPIEESEVLAADAGATNDYVGSYSRSEEDGNTSSVRFNDDDTYEYTAPDGTRSSGRYTRNERGRLAIEDFDGTPGYFVLRDGDLVRLPELDQPDDEIVVEGSYARDAEPATAPAGSTNSVGDKRN